MTSFTGLTTIEVEKRLEKFGKNKIQTNKKSVVTIFISQFKNWLLIILVAAALIAYFLGEKIDTLVILAIVLLSGFFSFFQEYKAERIVEKLKKFITSHAKVLRDGHWQEIDSQLLVVGDIVRLRVGDRVPADLRLLTADNLSIDESLLTGESAPVFKSTKNTDKQSNTVFASTFVSSGLATGEVITIGKDSLFGKTAQNLEKEAPQTDFQKQINNFSNLLFKVILLMTIFIFGVNALLHKGIFDSLLFAVALAVGITPELLPVIITITLSEGAFRMAKKHVVVKKLIAIEDFGNIDTLCVDKTGTLTEGQFLLDDFIDTDDKKSLAVLVDAVICSSGFSNQGNIFSSQIDQALWKSEAIKKMTNLNDFKLLDENELDFKRRRMSVVVKNKNNLRLLVKGAPESILEICTSFYQNQTIKNLTHEEKQVILQKIHGFEETGFITIAVAEKPFNRSESNINDEKEMIFKGLIKFKDPVKSGVNQSLELFKKLGVAIKLISGDSSRVVLTVAKEVGIAKSDTVVINGDQIEGLTDENLRQLVQKNNLFARVSPEQKSRIVSVLNQENHVVGFLGDGVNDALAIKAADVGIAVNTGAEVTKEAADIVLLKKDLFVLAQGIETGRKVFGNITKYILNTISANYGNMFTIAISSIFLPFIPLLPTQILLNNFISDVPLMAVATDKVDPGFTKKPKRWNIKFIGEFMVYFGLLSSLFDLATILPLIYIWRAGPEVFRTAWFIESSLSEILVTFSIRTKLPFYKSQPSGWLLGLSFIAILTVVILPFLIIGQKLFSFSSISLPIIIWIGVVLIGYFLATETVKQFFFKRFEY